jgi:hypothetical protein
MMSKSDKLRDRFAGQALQALLIAKAMLVPVEDSGGQQWCCLRYRRPADGVMRTDGSVSGTYAGLVAEEAYAYADAMLAQRTLAQSVTAMQKLQELTDTGAE